MGQGNKKRARRIDSAYNEDVIKHAKEQLDRLARIREEKALKWINAVMQNDETSTDEELKKYFQQNGLSAKDAEKIVSQRPKFFAEPCFEIGIGD